MRNITWSEVETAATEMLQRMCDDITPYELTVYGVPRGGWFAAMALKQAAMSSFMRDITLVEDCEAANVIVDDILDTGTTFERWKQASGKPVYTLFDKSKFPNEWLNLPWEGKDPTLGDSPHEGATDNIRRILQSIGEDVGREGLADTPDRVAKAHLEWFSGYDKKPEDVLKVFEDGASDVDEMVVQTDIPVYSFCEHHMAPIFGVAHVAYIPNGKVVGLSKLNRLVNVYARRLQVQERLTNQIADALNTHLGAKGAGVILSCRHMCMESRGVNAHGVVTSTSALRGEFIEPEVRSEFLNLVAMNKSLHNPIL